MTRNIHSLARCLAILLLTTGFAACNKYDKHYQIYELWVGGVKVTTRNQSDILGDGTVCYEGSQDEGTLRLKNAHIAENIDPEAEAVVISHLKNLTIQLEGENYIGQGEHTPVNGISTSNLTITGDGSLSVGARVSCVRAQTMRIESGKIDAYIKTPDEELATFHCVALWAQDLLSIQGGDITVHYKASFSPISYGLYSVKDVEIHGGNIYIDPNESRLMAVGLIASLHLKVTGGKISVYGFDDAMNAKFTHISGGEILAQSLDYPLDGVCRLAIKTEVTGGVLTISDMQHNPKSVKLFANDLQLSGMQIVSGANEASAVKREINHYGYTDSYIRIEKQE